jgi:hypothetical protein
MVSNGARIVFEHAAARPDASVFLRPSVIAEDVDDDDFDCDDGAVGADFALTHPNCKFNFFVDDDDTGMTESCFAETCADRNRKLSTNMSTALLETDAKPFFDMLLRSLLITPICFVLLTMQLNTTDTHSREPKI